MKKIIALIASLFAFNANAEVITLVAVSTPPECRAGHFCDIYSYHEIHVINASNKPEILNYSYQLCLQGICDNAQNTVTVYPGQHWDNSRQNQLHVKMIEGKYIYDVRTECGKEKAHNDYTIKVK
jgi:hypothetical protein